MSLDLHSIIPDPDQLLALEPEELAGLVLEHLNSLGKQSPNRAEDMLNRQHYIRPDRIAPYPRGKHQAIMQALTEAWRWLEREGLLAPRPQESAEWVFITKRGQQIKNRVDLQAFRQANLLPKGILHPVIAHKVWSQFIRREYETAVFQSFKEVEIAVRNSCGYEANDYGLPRGRKNLQSGFS